MRILITGGAGFIALHVVKYLIRATRWHIVLIDNLSTYPNSWQRLHDEGFSSHPRITRLTWDLTQPFSLGIRQEIGDINYILHLAHHSTIQTEKFFTCHENNTACTINILKYMQSLESKPLLLYFSESSIYAVNSERSIKEWEPTSPSSNEGLLSSLQEELLKSQIAQDQNIILTTGCAVYGEYAPPSNITHNILHTRQVPSTMLYGYQVAEELSRLFEDGVPGEKYHISSKPLAEDNSEYSVVPSVHLSSSRMLGMGRPEYNALQYVSSVCSWYEVNSNWKV